MSICFGVKIFATLGNIGKNSFGICIPLPNILSIPKLPKAETAPVAKAGTAFVNPFTANGNTFASKLASVEKRFPPCFATFLIFVLLILISAPVPLVKVFEFF